MNKRFSIHQGVLQLQDLDIRTEDLEKALAAIPKNEAEAITTLDLSKAVLLQHLPNNLSRFPRTGCLFCNQCHSLTDLSGIEGLEELANLSASRCYKLKNIHAVGNLSLQHIDLGYCSSMLDFHPLKSQTGNLETLGLSGLFVFHNAPAFVTEMNKFVRLQILDVHDSSISKLIQPIHLQALRCRIQL